MITDIEITFTHEDGTKHKATVDSDGYRQWGADNEHLGEAVDCLEVLQEWFTGV